MAATAAGRRTAVAYPRFVAAHGYDWFASSNQPVAQVAKLPEVSQLVEAPIPLNGQPTCACTHPINAIALSTYQLSPRALARTVNLVAGRMPDQSDPGQVLVSFNLAQATGVHIGTVIHMPFFATSQAAAVFNAPGLGPTPTGPTVTFRVVGIESAEVDFASGSSTLAYSMFTTQAFARTVLPKTATATAYFVSLRHGTADGPRFKNDIQALGIDSDQSEDIPALLESRSIHPQAVGWWALALLAAIAGVAVVAQAVSRQRSVESADYPAFAAMGVTASQLVGLGLASLGVVAVVGAIGAAAVAYALSPIAPVGVARFAESSAGFSFDTTVLVLGVLVIVAVVLALGVWPAVRDARVHTSQARARHRRPSAVVARVAALGAPPSVVVGVRHALERGRGANSAPVGTALLGTVLAVTALCGTAVFGSSLAHLNATPSLYGNGYQLVIYGGEGNGIETPQLLRTLEHEKGITGITLGTGGTVSIGNVPVTTFGAGAVRGPVFLSVVNGRFPGRNQIALGSTTMRQVGAHVGSVLPVTLHLPSGGTSTVRLHVVGTVALPTGIAADQTGLGIGAAISLDEFFHAACPPGPRNAPCVTKLRATYPYAVFVTAAPGAVGRAAIAHLTRAYQPNAVGPAPPSGLVNFGEAVNFPLIFGVMLAIFGVATLGHLLVVSLGRRRNEMGLLKALGLRSGQVAAAVFWQSITVAIVGIVIGAPLGAALGRLTWSAFATNVGVVPVPIVDFWWLGALVVGVAVGSALLALAPAIIASRTRPSRLLTTQ